MSYIKERVETRKKINEAKKEADERWGNRKMLKENGSGRIVEMRDDNGDLSPHSSIRSSTIPPSPKSSKNS